MKNKEKLYLDKEGYEQYLKEIDKLKKDLKRNSLNKSSAHQDAVGDGWHDNAEFEEAKRKELMIIASIEEKIKGLSRIVIIKKSKRKDVIDLGDVLTVKMFFSEDEIEDLTFKLVGFPTPKTDDLIKEVSVNSPLGKAVYQKKVGDNFKYEVRGNIITVSILEKHK